MLIQWNCKTPRRVNNLSTFKKANIIVPHCSIVPHDFRIWLMVEKVVATPQVLNLARIIIDNLPLWFFERFFPNNSSMSRGQIICFTLLASHQVLLKIRTFFLGKPNGPQPNASKEEPISRVFANWCWDLLAKNLHDLMMIMEGSIWSTFSIYSQKQA